MHFHRLLLVKLRDFSHKECIIASLSLKSKQTPFHQSCVRAILSAHSQKVPFFLLDILFTWLNFQGNAHH